MIFCAVAPWGRQSLVRSETCLSPEEYNEEGKKHKAWHPCTVPALVLMCCTTALFKVDTVGLLLFT